MILSLKKFRPHIAVLAAVIMLFAAISPMLAKAFAEEKKEVSLPVIMYHQLTEKPSRAGRYVLMLEQFERDLIYLKEKGYQTVTATQVIDFVYSKGTLPEKPVMITFDDGCETVYALAAPLLEKYGFSAVAFVVGAWADFYSEADDHNLDYSNLDWQEISELSQGKTVDIQSHTFDLHINNSGRSGAKMKKSETKEAYCEFLTLDAAKMKERMMKHTGKAPVALAYPFGSFSDCSDEILKNCGILMTLTCFETVSKIKKAEPASLYGLGRYNRPNGISSESFFEKMGI